MMIKVAKSAGFCPGVRQAVEKAEEIVSQDRNDSLVMLGEIVHNQHVVQELLNRGATIIDQAIEAPEGAEVLVRAHGITLEEENILKRKSCQIHDQTCGWVKRIHKLAEEAREKSCPFILCGTAQHPEVVGILSRAGKWGRLIQSEKDALNAEFSEDYAMLCAQTTFSVASFEKIKAILRDKIAKIEIFDTICFTTVKRQIEAKELAEDSDLVLVLGNKNSSNTGKLYDICRSAGRETILIERPDQVPALFKGRDLRQLRIGITAGASTPERLIREVIHLMTENQTFSNEQEENMLNQPEAEETNQAEAGDFEFPEAPVEQKEEDASASEASQEQTQAEEVKEEVEETEDKVEALENGDISFADFIDEIPQLKRGVVVKGTIVRYDDEFVYVDVRDKSEGKVPRHEFADSFDVNLDEAIAEHREIEVFVRNIKNSDMGKEILLSKAKVDFTKHKDAIQKAFEEKVPVMVKVTNVVRDGVIASYGSVDLYIHRTQLELHVVDDLEPYRGQTMEVLITQFDPNRKRLRVSGSRRSLLQQARKEKAKVVWDNIEPGMEVIGIVRNLTDFGAFVDIGGVDGLVHISELSWDRIKHPSEVVQVGDKINVVVKDFDKDRRRISLGFRREEDDPYYNIEERFPMGSIVRGIVVRMFNFGAFVEIAPGVDALCHISQISNYRLNRPEDVLQVGMEVDARVLEVSNEARKISISIKEVEPIDPENPEDLKPAFQPRNRDEHDDGERSFRPRRPRNNRPEEDEGPTTYVDEGAGSSLSALANFNVTSDEGADMLKSLGIEEDNTDAAESADGAEESEN